MRFPLPLSVALNVALELLLVTGGADWTLLPDGRQVAFYIQLEP